jgi:predicted transcriptional regulator
MTNRQRQLSSSQRRNIEEFLDCFAEIEQALKNKLGRRANDTTGVRKLIDEYSGRNGFWSIHANQLRGFADIWNILRGFADIRNILTHQRRTTVEYPIIIAPSSLREILQIRDHLLKPEPVGTNYSKAVSSVSPTQSLASILALAFQNGFSQFPVIHEEKFGGLVTENEIMRWMGRHAQTRSTEINLENVTVRSVLKEKDPDLRGIAIFHFARLDAPSDEVMSRFSTEPALEAILLTQSGNKATPIEGIITQWDAARYRR